jgi:N-acetylneuraminate synthase
LILLKCTSAYPATPENANILTIPNLQQRFKCHAGLSDHTMGIGVAVASVALGAVVIEKHFTLSRADGGVDASFSLEPDELAALVRESHRAWQALGAVTYGPTGPERESLRYRRSLYIVRDMQAGDSFTPETIRALRPGGGLPPKHIDAFLGRKAKHALTKGTPVSWDLLE